MDKETPHALLKSVVGNELGDKLIAELLTQKISLNFHQTVCGGTGAAPVPTSGR